MIQELLTKLRDWLELFTPIGILFGFIWRFWLKKKFDQLTGLYAKVQKIADEFAPNGGSTLRDAINRIEDKINLQEQKTLAIIKSFPIGTWISDKHGKCVDVNRSLCKIMHRTESEIKGDNWSNWIHPDEKEYVFDEWNKAVHSMMTFDMTYRYVLPDGRFQKVHGVAYQLRSENDELVGFLGTLYAIGEPV